MPDSLITPHGGNLVDTLRFSPEEAAQEIILHLEREGFIGTDSPLA